VPDIRCFQLAFVGVITHSALLLVGGGSWVLDKPLWNGSGVVVSNTKTPPKKLRHALNPM
jgi:hypothetical protein